MNHGNRNRSRFNARHLDRQIRPQNAPTRSRRDFIRDTGLALAGLTVVPRHVLGGAGRIPPSQTIQVAGIGVGGVGHGQITSVSRQKGVRIAYLCDVDQAYARRTYDRFPEAKRYRDFREMLDSEGDKIDAVYCGTPDHTHAVISLAALDKDKHVCCVKPLTRTIHEERILARAARRAQLATQVTASSNTTDAVCRLCEMIWDGAIGDVREAHVWSNRPLWPQGMLRPPGQYPVPKTLDWDLWIGPAPMRPFVAEWPAGDLALRQVKASRKPRPAVYHPWNFRGWWDFGTGALGDMGCHHFNHVFKALKLRYPTAVSASASQVFDETAPLASIVTYDFPAREGMPPLRLVWYDGGLKPPRPPQLEPGRQLPNSGNMYIGDKGVILENRIIPEQKMSAYKLPPKTLTRRSGTWGEWVEAIRGGQEAACNFEWASVLAEAVLLGNIAIRTGKPLNWDAGQMKFTNNDPANEYVRPKYRSGWSL
ncbi:MAG: Gfo/Idh/MocA family oxidoreductase [Phycisphaerales bacterium]|nr:MAG: Gfo/Idh/MocA family oxidoreductase [Phycisphaerales bacterium]